MTELLECDVPSMSPSKVCMQCFVDNTNATWLSYLTCIKPDQHFGINTVTAVVISNYLIHVRPPSHQVHKNLSDIVECKNVSTCKKKFKCKLAHSDIELNYWRLMMAKKIFCERVPKLVSLQHRLSCCVCAVLNDTIL